MHCAIIYDFDGTLAKGDGAKHRLMNALGTNDDRTYFLIEIPCHDGFELQNVPNNVPKAVPNLFEKQIIQLL